MTSEAHFKASEMAHLGDDSVSSLGLDKVGYRTRRSSLQSVST